MRMCIYTHACIHQYTKVLYAHMRHAFDILSVDKACTRYCANTLICALHTCIYINIHTFLIPLANHKLLYIHAYLHAYTPGNSSTIYTQRHCPRYDLGVHNSICPVHYSDLSKLFSARGCKGSRRMYYEESNNVYVCRAA
jgi:hypothetical protein